MTADSRPSLTPRARLRYDRIAGKFLLLYPERGLVLSPTAHEVLQLCTGTQTVHMIIEQLASRHREASQAAVARDVRGFLQRLHGLGLIRGQE